MPKAKTGCEKILYSLITPEADKHLTELVGRSQVTSGWPVSRALVLDHMIKARQESFRIARPEYKPHAKVKKR